MCPVHDFGSSERRPGPARPDGGLSKQVDKLPIFTLSDRAIVRVAGRPDAESEPVGQLAGSIVLLFSFVASLQLCLAIALISMFVQLPVCSDLLLYSVMHLNLYNFIHILAFCFCFGQYNNVHVKRAKGG